MLKLILFQNGTKQSEIELSPDREYILGRAPTCDLVLNSTEISRQHAKLIFENDVWKIKVLSRFGKIHVSGNPIEEVTLAAGSTFSIHPFELQLQEAEPIAAHESVAHSTVHSGFEPEEPMDSGKTVVGVVPTDFYLVQLNENGEPLAEIALGGGVLEAGRSRSAQIPLDDPASSGRHFALEKKDGEFVLTDLKSANGTLVNGEPVQTVTLKSGDEIQVGNIKLRFEVRNQEFENLTPVPVTAESNDDSTEPAVIKLTSPPAVSSSRQPTFYQTYSGPYSSASLPAPRRKKSLARITTLLLLPLLGYGLLTQNSGSLSQSSKKTGATDSGAAPKSPEQVLLEKLTPEQRKLIEDTYRYAESLFQGTKYEQAAIEYHKILEYLPNYKDSKDKLAKCEVAMETQRQTEEIQRQDRERQQVQVKVSEVLDGCENLLKARRFNEIERCVSQINEMDPDNERGQNLVTTAKVEIEKNIERNHANAAAQKRKIAAESQFVKAERLYQKKKYRPAILAFEKILDMPGGAPLRAPAAKKIKEANDRINKESSASLTEGKAAFEAKDYKTAVRKLQTAVDLSPENADAKSALEKAMAELRTLMKNIYTESVLEENSGNIESAKKKWQQILDQDVPGGNYYNKAQIKMKKYVK